MTLPLDAGDIKTAEGGVEFKGRLFHCYLANLHLRTANRVLMRVTEFNATNFGRLEKKLGEIPWELFLTENGIPKIIVTTRHSRLYHSDAISERIIESINKRKSTTLFLTEGNSGTQIQNIFIRSIDDHITVSLDSTGDLLYKRGIKQHSGKAPIRENLAASALIKAGFTGEEPLLDPMCGTGTFSIEAAMITRCIPPGWHRDFSFQSWPAFRPAQWAHLKMQTEEDIRPAGDMPVIMACDKDKKMCMALSDTLKQFNLENTVTVLNTDFFNLTPADVYKTTGYDSPGLVIINPPYGIRLGTIKKSRILLEQIIERLTKYFSGWKIAIFSPEKEVMKSISIRGEQTTIDHGGIRLILFTGIIPGSSGYAP